MNARGACNSTPRRWYARAACDGVRGLLAGRDVRLVGIWSGGAWLAERLQAELGLRRRPASVSSTSCTATTSAKRGLAAGCRRDHAALRGRTASHLLLIDDVLYTGRTIRAVINELFDYGRPASVCSWRCWWTAAGANCRSRPAFAAARVVTLPAAQKLTAGARRRPGASASSIVEGPQPDVVASRNPQLNAHGELIHLLSIEGLPKAVLTQILDTAGTFLSASTTAR